MERRGKEVLNCKIKRKFEMTNKKIKIKLIKKYQSNSILHYRNSINEYTFISGIIVHGGSESVF